MQQSHRQAALAVLAVQGGKPLPAALESAIGDDAGPARGFVQELAYGTLRHLGTLDFWIDALATRGDIDPRVRALLAVALYQLEHGRAPAFAVVDQAVEAVGTWVSPGVKPFVNALLRRFLRERESLLLRARGEPVARYSYPSWWIGRVQSDWPDAFEPLLDAGNARPPLALRVNRRVGTREALLARFAEAGVGGAPGGEAGIVVDPPCDIVALPGFAEGAFSVQDLGAQLAAPLLAPRDGERVLDACAAPGGKAAHLLELADIELLALDNDEHRLVRVRDNFERLRLARPSTRVIAGDAASPRAWWDGKPFDAILADVPCSASGVVRRHPDAKWLRRSDDIPRLARTQSRLLDALWPLLAPDGRLLYVTCSVFRAENEARIDAFMAGHPGALREPLTFPGPVAHSGGQCLPSAEGARHNQDGFFYALLRKV